MSNVVYLLPKKHEAPVTTTATPTGDDQNFERLSHQIQDAVFDVLSSTDALTGMLKNLMIQLDAVDRVIDAVSDPEWPSALRSQAEKNRQSLSEAARILSLEIEKISAFRTCRVAKQADYLIRSAQNVPRADMGQSRK